jgi:glyoxalase family protein
MNEMELLGLHHISGITGNVPSNYNFFAATLGLRLVKKTVNQDDVRAYHLYYADQRGTPGTDVTFFDYARSPKERRGNNSITRTGLRVPVASLEWWRARLTAAGVGVGAVGELDARPTVLFEDLEGGRFALVGDDAPSDAQPWTAQVPAEHTVKGLGPVWLTVPRLEATARVLTDVLHMRRVREYANPDSPIYPITVFEMGEGGVGAEVHVATRPDLPPSRSGAGAMHHVAFRVPDAATHTAWLEHLRASGIQSSAAIDRHYFRALYFREPNGVLFELSTDGPGFATDEREDQLGTRLALPPFLESQRADIEANLEPLEFARQDSVQT